MATGGNTCGFLLPKSGEKKDGNRKRFRTACRDEFFVITKKLKNIL